MEFRELPALPSTSDPSDDDDLPSKYKKKTYSHRGKKHWKRANLSTSIFDDDKWTVTESGESNENNNLSISSSFCSKKEDGAPCLKYYKTYKSFSLQRPSNIAHTGDKMNMISILAFLKDFHEVYIRIGIYKGVVTK